MYVAFVQNGPRAALITLAAKSIGATPLDSQMYFF